MQKGLVLPDNIVYQITCEDAADGLSLAQHLEKHFYVTRTWSDNDHQSFHAAVPIMRSDDLEQYLEAFVIDYEYIESY